MTFGGNMDDFCQQLFRCLGPKHTKDLQLVHQISEFAECVSSDTGGGHLRMPTPHPAFL